MAHEIYSPLLELAAASECGIDREWGEWLKTLAVVLAWSALGLWLKWAMGGRHAAT